ncbi:transient receptor potential cation channel subfamily V member 5-like isoform X1 [Petromyzon marinus]|uniref:transient receptor potential cation channel subfamily V member 5-like isoform X1 n=2 Tax=Petromyzon marinus TaxID=7757 RepID=UPI003F70F0E8
MWLRWWRHRSCKRGAFSAASSDRLHLLQQKRIKEIPLFLAAMENDRESILKLLNNPDTDPYVTGALGETALHIAVLYNSNDAALALADATPQLINLPVYSHVYKGQTALHMAVLQQNVALVRALVVRGADAILPRATGTFSSLKGGGCCGSGAPGRYYGEHVLTFAACTGNEDIMRILLENHVPVHAQDSLGNTVLHVLVLQPNKNQACAMHQLLLSCDRSGAAAALEAVQNHDGLTPIKMAAANGNTVMFQNLVTRRRAVQWVFGSVTSSIYDLSGIDSWDDEQSVIELIASSRRREARRILDITPVKELVSLKWSLYGRRYFWLWALIYMCYIVIFTLCCIYRPLELYADYNASSATLQPPSLGDFVMVQRPLAACYDSYDDFLRLSGEIVVVVGAVMMLVFEVRDMIRTGVKRYFGSTVTGGPFHIIMICYSCLVMLLLLMRLTNTHGEYVPMAVALVLGWCNTMFFARGFEMLGPFTIMIQKMLFGDLLRFCWLMLMVLLGYASAFHICFQLLRREDFLHFAGFETVLFTMFQLFLGLLDIPIPYDKQVPIIIKLVYVSYMIFAFLLMVNLLIAMMGDTHWRVAHERDELWRAQVAATTVLLERRLPRWLWPRLGYRGDDFGLDNNKWYMRVEDSNESTMFKMKKYARTLKKAEADDCPVMRPPSSNLQVGPARKSGRGWRIVRRSTMGEMGDPAREAETTGPAYDNEEAEMVYNV